MVEKTADDSVTIVDPTHPLFGRTFRVFSQLRKEFHDDYAAFCGDTSGGRSV